MSIQVLKPEGLFSTNSYAQAVIAKGTRTVYVSGQVALDEKGQLVGKDDLAAQAEQVYLNLGAALRAAGTTYAAVAKLTAYVPNWTPDKMEPLVTGAMRAATRIGFDPNRAMTLIGVAALAQPDFLIEIEAVAVIDDGA